jgi:hypothetical protein
MKTLARPGDKDELLRRLTAVSPATERRWGSMSAHQMVCHVADCFLMALGERPVSAETGWQRGPLFKWIALYLPVPWPRGINTRPELDQVACAGTTPAEFAADVAALRVLLDRVAAPGDAFRWPAHPMFGHMSGDDWLRWGYLHMDHHLRQFGA